MDKWVLLVTLLVCTNSFPFGCEGLADGPIQPLANALSPSTIRPLVDRPTQELIDRICRQNEDYGFCLRVISEGLNTPSANINQLEDLIIYRALKHATDTYIFIGNILRSGSTKNPRERQGLQTCLEVYIAQGDAFTDATNFFKKKLYGQMRESILRAPRSLVRCATNFVVPPTRGNLDEKNREMRIITTMAAVAGRMLSVMPR